MRSILLLFLELGRFIKLPGIFPAGDEQSQQQTKPDPPATISQT
jgi:hypothetical protein